jgi:2-oxoglutarate dehydrogenase E1 component
MSVSPIEDFETDKGFQEVIEDTNVGKKVRKILFCSGKIAYELLAKKETDNAKDIAIVRLEQLYPYPEAQVQAILDKHKGAKTLWVQEEPENNGAWEYLTSRFAQFKNAELVARRVSSSPATGYAKVHTIEQTDILNRAFA